MFKTNLKSKLIIAVMVIFGITAFMSCEKEEITNKSSNDELLNNDYLKSTNQNVTNQKRLYDRLMHTNQNTNEYRRIIQKLDYIDFNYEEFGKLNLNEMYVLYPSIDTNYFYFVINTFDTYENENEKKLTRLLIVYNKVNNESKSVVLRMEAVKENDNFIAGQETFFSPVGYYIGHKLYNTDLLLSEISNYPIAYTYEEFKDCYQDKKAECEDDWLCDLACSFNPCAVSYAAACLIEMML